MPRVPNGTFLVATGEVGAQYMSLPGRTWKWPDATIVEDDFSPGILIPEEIDQSLVALGAAAALVGDAARLAAA